MSRLRVELWADDTLVADSDDRDLWTKVLTVVAAQRTTPSSPVDRHADRERQGQRPASRI